MNTGRSIILTLLAFATSSNAFAPSSILNTVKNAHGTTQQPISGQPITTSSLQMSDTTVETKAPVLPKPALMDEGIFTFNKVLIDTVYNIICFFYPVTGGKRDFARFYVLETVARVPYFAYLSVMHLRYDIIKILQLEIDFTIRFLTLFVSFICSLFVTINNHRETFGERGLGENMRTHYAEADNELHHLLIMESLGGNENAIDR